MPYLSSKQMRHIWDKYVTTFVFSFRRPHLSEKSNSEQGVTSKSSRSETLKSIPVTITTI